MPQESNSVAARKNISEYAYRYPRHEVLAPTRVNGHQAGATTDTYSSGEKFQGESLTKATYKAPPLSESEYIKKNQSCRSGGLNGNVAATQSYSLIDREAPSQSDSVYRSSYATPLNSSFQRAKAPPSIFVSGGQFISSTTYQSNYSNYDKHAESKLDASTTITAQELKKKLRETVVGRIGEPDERLFHTEHATHFNNKGFVKRAPHLPFHTPNLGLFGGSDQVEEIKGTYARDFKDHSLSNNENFLNLQRQKLEQKNKSSKSISSINFEHDQ